MKIIVLGAGLVGGPMAVDLAREKEFNVTSVDKSENALDKLKKNYPINTIVADLSNHLTIKELIHDYDLVVNAVPGFMGYSTLKTIIEAGKNVVDISFFEEDAFQLDELAKEKEVTAIVDCGVAPGMSNVLVGYVDKILDKTESAIIYVGGLPQVRVWPYEYQAVFSPVDVIEEYTRPARYIENGYLVTRPALSDPELIYFPGVGTLEAFNSDGLRSLAQTIDAPNLKEKTLRYPGHIEKMAVLRETGFFDKKEIEINGTKIRPLDFTSKLLFPMWEMNKGNGDITVMKVQVSGVKDGKKIQYTYDLLDRYDAATDTISMARTTGYTATATVRLLHKGLFNRKGVCPPEMIGENCKCVSFLLEELKKRGIVYTETIESI